MQLTLRKVGNTDTVLKQVHYSQYGYEGPSNTKDELRFRLKELNKIPREMKLKTPIEKSSIINQRKYRSYTRYR